MLYGWSCECRTAGAVKAVWPELQMPHGRSCERRMAEAVNANAICLLDEISNLVQ